MSRDDNVAIARASYDAYAVNDRAAMEALVADDLRFTSPFDNRIGRAAFFEYCWPGSEGIEAFDLVHLVPDGDRVFVTYEARTQGGRGFRNTEIVTVRSGQIAEVEVYFGWSMPHDLAPGEHDDGDPSGAGRP